MLLANAYNELPYTDIHSVSVVDLAAKLGFKSGNQEYLKEMLRSLRSCEVEWNLLNKDNKQVWGVAGLLASVEIENGICTYGFAPHLRQKLHNPRIYAKLNLRLQNRFKSQYALVLWEVCFDYFDADRSKGETPFIPLSTLKELMGLKTDEYPVFGFLNRDVIKPAIREINALTNYHVDVESKRLGRRIAELKFHIKRVKHLPVQESVFPDIENLPRVAVELVQAEIDRKIALRIAEQEWDFVNSEKLPVPGRYADFLSYIAEKVEMSVAAVGVKNRPGYIVKAIRENYQDPELQKARELRAERVKQKGLEDLEADYHAKKRVLLRQAVHQTPDLLERAAAKITSRFVLSRLETSASVAEAYKAGGMVTSEINYILAEEFCQDLLAPVMTAYEDEKARLIQGK